MNLGTFGKLPYVMALVSLCGVPALAAKNVLEVSCVDQNGQSLDKVKVYTYAIAKQKVKNKNSKRGIAKIDKLDDDYYRVWARTDGYLPAFYEFVHLEGDITKTVELKFLPGDSTTPLYFEDETVRQRSNDLLSEGADALRKQQYEVAEAKLTESVSINPSGFNAYHNLGLLYLQTRKWEKARESLNKVIDLIPIFVALQKQDPAIAGQLTNQRNEVKKMIDTIPLQILAAEAGDAMTARKFDVAADRLYKLAEAQPNNPNVYYQLAIALTRQIKLDEATTAIDKAIKLQPTQTAFTDLKERIDRIKASSEAERLRGELAQVDKLNGEGKYAEALQKADELADRISDDYKSLLWLVKARAHKGLDQQDETVAAYLEAIKLSKSENKYAQEMVNYLMEKEAYEEAFSAYRKACDLSSTPADEGLFELGQNLVSKGKQKIARVAFENVLEINPDHSEAYYELGMDYFYESGDREKAKSMLERYLEKGSDEAHLSNAKSVLAVIAKQAG